MLRKWSGASWAATAYNSRLFRLLTHCLTLRLLLATAGGWGAAADVIRGVILDTAGGRLQNAVVEVMRGATVLTQMETNERGEFELGDVPRGEYRINITKAQYITTSVRLSFNPRDRGSREGPYIRLIRQSSVGGALMPAMSGRVALIADTAISDSRLVRISEVHGDGTFRISHVAPGRYYLALLNADGEIERGRGLVLYPTSSSPKVIDVPPGMEDVNIRLAVPTRDVHSIAGVIRAKNLARAGVTVVAVANPQIPIVSKMTGADGIFKFTGLWPGRYYILGTAVSNGGSVGYGRIGVDLFADRDGVSIDTSVGTTIAVQVGADPVATCGRDAELQFDSIEKWLPEVRVIAVRTSGGRGTILELPAGHYQASARSSNGQCYAAVTTVLDGQSIDGGASVQLVLRPPGQIRGHIDEKGAVVVYLIPCSAREPVVVEAIIAGSEGNYNFTGLEPGRYALGSHLAADDRTPWLESLTSVDIVYGDTRSLNVTGRLSGGH